MSMNKFIYDIIEVLNTDFQKIYVILVLSGISQL